MQPTKKISQLPQTTTPTVSDKAPIVSGGITDYVLLSDLIALFSANVPAGANSQITRTSELMFDHIFRGTGVWTADNVGVNRVASMTAATCYINGRRISISAVSARTFTASKDTYVDVLDNGDGTGTLVYTEVANNAASPALAANSVRVGIIITGATTIATTASINQGQEDRVLPIASSIPYAVADSLGNLICPRDPNRQILCFRQIVANITTTSTTQVQATGLSCPVIVPAGRKIEIEALVNLQSGTNIKQPTLTIWEGTVGSGTQKNKSSFVVQNLGIDHTLVAKAEYTPGSASITLNLGWASDGGGGVTTTMIGSSTEPAYIKVSLK